MVVLRSEREEEWRHSEGYRQLQLRYGMPIDWRPRLWEAASIHACRAVVAARLRWPDREAPLLRRLRVLGMGGALLDDSDTLEQAAAEAGLPVEEIAAFCATEEVETELGTTWPPRGRPRRRRSRRTTSSPARPAGSATRARRSRCSARPPRTRRGGRPRGSTSRASGRSRPTRRPWPTSLPSSSAAKRPGSVLEVLAWAGMPLATAEVAAISDREVQDVRAELARVARFAPVGGDGYWSAE